MINYLSYNIADYFYLNKVIEEEEKVIYVYGLQLIMSTVVGITLIIIIGLILNKFLLSLIFLMTFISIRMYSGGYHANSYVKCNLTLISIFLTVLMAIKFTPMNYIIIISVIMIISTYYIIYKYAPVDNENKRLTEKKKKENKRITLYLLTGFYFMGLVMLHRIRII